ncbi:MULTISPECIES: hypothetical protein [Streptomyces]|uniref:hypothetical protein n=1 Tax=Streptomyces TaxID=1883 RepID=UPI000A579FED|nr:hypothetical protein [Streptomyces katrae]
MANTRDVSVGAPDGAGRRQVLIDGDVVGEARSPGQLRRILQRAGVPPDHPVYWRGADSTVWPRAGWRRTIAFVMIAGFVATAVPLFQIGLADSGNALTYGGRIAGVTVLFAAVVEVIAVGAAVNYWYWNKPPWRYSGAVVLAGVAISLLCSISLLLLQIGEHFNKYTAVGIILGTWSLAALIGLVKCRAWKGLRNPKKIAVGAVVSALLASANLAYSQIYLPYVTTPLIQSGAEFKEASLRKDQDRMYVTVHLYVRNAGRVPVYILDSIYWVHGGPANIEGVKTHRYELIYDGDFVSPVGRVLKPGEEIAQDEVVQVLNAEKKNFEVIRAQTEVYAIREDRVKMGPDYSRSGIGGRDLQMETEKGDPPSVKYRYRARISNSSEILNVTRDEQRITVWRTASPEWPGIVVDVSPPGERIAFDPLNPYANEKAIDRYGLAQVRGSTVEVPYAELLEKAGAVQKGTG